MAKAKASNGRGYRRFLLLYALLILLPLLVLLRFGWQFLSDYEASQPKYFMDSYIRSLDAEHIRSIVDNTQLDYNRDLISDGELREAMAQQLSQGSFSYVRDGTVSARNSYRYSILLDGVKKGSVTIAKDENPNFYTFAPWRVVSEDFGFTITTGEPVEVTVPESWSVEVNGHTLDESYIVRTGIQIPGLEDYYDEDGVSLEHLVTYRIDQYLSLRELRTLDADGQEHILSDDPVENAELFASGLYDNDNEDVQWLVREYIDRYVRYSSNTNHNPRGNLASLKALIVGGSDLEKRMESALEALEWTNGKGYEIKEINFNSILRLDGGWIADVTYITDVVGTTGQATTTVNNCKFTLIEVNGILLVDRHKVY